MESISKKESISKNKNLLGCYISLHPYKEITIPDDVPFQCFIHSPHGHPSKGEKTVIERWTSSIHKFKNDTPRIIHCSYVTVPWNFKKESQELSLRDIYTSSHCANIIGIQNYLIHLPSLSLYESDEHFSEVVEKCFENLEDPCTLLFENDAHHHGWEILGKMRDLILKIQKEKFKNKKWGFCFDTAHAFASGIPLTTSKEAQMCIKKLESFPIKLVHLNGNLRKFNGGIDKHTLPSSSTDLIWSDDVSGLKVIMNWCVAKEIPMIVEQTGSQEYENYIGIFEKLKKIM